MDTKLFSIIYICSFWMILMIPTEIYGKENMCATAPIIPQGQNGLLLEIFYQTKTDTLFEQICENLDILRKFNHMKMQMIPSALGGDKITVENREQLCASKILGNKMPYFSCCRVYEQKSLTECAKQAQVKESDITTCANSDINKLDAELRANGANSTKNLGQGVTNGIAPICRFNQVTDVCTQISGSYNVVGTICLILNVKKRPTDICNKAIGSS